MAYPFTGGGDRLDFGLPAGGGDLLPFPGVGGGNYLTRVPLAVPYQLRSLEADGPTTQEDLYVWVGEEGGYFLELSSALAIWRDENKAYIIQLVDAVDQTWPLYEPGCHGGEPGLGAAIIATKGGHALQFASPRAPEGYYSLRITDSAGFIYEPPIKVRVVPKPSSREVNSVRAMFPSTVYNPYPD
jgi:hypothetical protein